MEGEISYNRVGVNTIYGNSPTICHGLQELERLFVMDTSEEQLEYLRQPQPYIPASKPGKGRKKTSWVSDINLLKAKELLDNLPDGQYKTYTIRQGTKGPITRRVVVRKCIDGKLNGLIQIRWNTLRLIISRNVDGSKVKYSLTNDVSLPHSACRTGALYRQMQRYWVGERHSGL